MAITGSFFNPLHPIVERQVETVRVPSNTTVYSGYLLLAETLATSHDSAGAINDANRQVYAGAAVGTIATDKPVIVWNTGFEQLSDKRRPSGQPLYTEYSATAGMDVTVLRPEVNDKYAISSNVLASGTPAVGDFICPTASSQKWTLTAAASGAPTSALILKIEAIEKTGYGGIGGMDNFSTLICRVIAA